MQASNIPTKVQVPFANSAGSSYIRPIPVASQITTTPGAASFTDGFPPVTFEPTASGGIPPFGQDVNGILNQISAWTRWQCAGGPVAYDATWQAEVGGYPQGAIIESATTLGTIWLSLVDNNTTNPDTGGAGWVNFATVILAYVVAAGATNAWTGMLAVPPASLYDGFLIRVQFSATNTAAAPTFNMNATGAKVIYASDGSTALAIGQLPKNALLQWSASAGGWVCLNVSSIVASVTVNSPLSGNGTPGNPIQLTNPGYLFTVATQSPITGNGTSGSPIGFSNPGYLTAIYVTAPISGDGTSGNPLKWNGASVTGPITGNGTPGSPLGFSNPGYLTGVAVQSPITGNGTSGSPIGFSGVAVDGTSVTGNGTSGSPLASHAPVNGTIFAAYYGGASPVITTGSANSGASTPAYNIASISQNSGTLLYHVVFSTSAPANYVVVFGAYGNVSGAGGAAGTVAQASVIGAGNEYGYPSPTANEFYIFAGDIYGETPCPPFICVLI